jgi:hypothetical protein
LGLALVVQVWFFFCSDFSSYPTDLTGRSHGRTWHAGPTIRPDRRVPLSDLTGGSVVRNSKIDIARPARVEPVTFQPRTQHLTTKAETTLW